MIKKIISFPKTKELSKQEQLSINGGISPQTRFCLRQLGICLASSTPTQTCISQRDACLSGS